MDINYKFSNIIGTVYRQGQVIFSPDGYSVISPVGNKLNIFDLKNNISRTLALETTFNIYALAVNHVGTHVAVADEKGDVHYVNLSTETTLHKYRANRMVKSLSFSPDGAKLAICRDSDLQIMKLNISGNQMFHPFSLHRTYKISSDRLNWVEWSFDSKLLVVGGQDKVVRVCGAEEYENFFVHQLGGHKGRIITCQFQKNSYDLLTVCSRGVANVWTSSLQPGDLVEGTYKSMRGVKEEDETEDVSEVKPDRIFFEKTKKYVLLESSGSGKGVDVTACRLHVQSNLLVTAFNNGVFVLHEVPSFSLIHNLRVSDMKIQSLAINQTGDWLAIACGKGSAAQLVVWEWQSETYVLKQQSHSLRVTTAEYSPDGGSVATGAEDGKVKIWNGRSAFCTVTFDEHTSAVTAVKWTQNGKAILSASLDGTVRAHDLARYRNFRTLVCPEPTQFGSLAVDKTGDIVAAAGKEVFNIFIWSLETGHLLDVLSGHESAISAIDIHGNQIVSSSWDRTFKIWNVVDSQAETTELAHEAVCVKFSPAGDLVAVLTVDSTVNMYDSKEGAFIGAIEAHLDLDPSRGRKDQITKKNAARNKSFTSLQFSPDGNLLLLGGESVHFCLYSVPDKLLVKKFTLTANRSLDGVALDINRRNLTEFGNLDLIDTSDEEMDHNYKREIQLPGTRNFDLGERRARPEVNIFNVTFCPTGRKFAVCSTEGVNVYSLDVVSLFDPFKLDSNTSPAVVHRSLRKHDYSTALMASVRLADNELITLSMEATSITQIALVARVLPVEYAERLLKWMAEGNVVSSSKHVNFYMIWIRELLREHGMKLKSRGDVAILTAVQQVLSYHSQLITKMASTNKFSLKYLNAARKIARKPKEEEMED